MPRELKEIPSANGRGNEITARRADGLSVISVGGPKGNRVK